MDSPVAYRRALLFGVLAHVATGVYSFVAKPVTVAFGSVGGGFAVYSLTLVMLLVWYLGSSQLRKELSAWRRIVQSAKLGRALLLTLLCYSLGAVCFYQGLITSQNVALYATYVRLDALLLILWGWLLLHERVRPVNLIGCALAFVGVALLTAWGAMSLGELFWGAIYVCLMTVAGRYTRDLLMPGGFSPKTLLCLRTASVTLFMAMLIPFTTEAHLAESPSLQLYLPMGFAALVLVGIFWFRFAALAQLPLWRFWAFSPIHAIVGVSISVLLGQSLTTIGVVGVSLIALGEVIAHIKVSSKSEH